MKVGGAKREGEEPLTKVGGAKTEEAEPPPQEVAQEKEAESKDEVRDSNSQEE